MKNSLKIIIPLTSLLAFFDQYSKYLIEKYLTTEVSIIKDYFEIVYHTNPGIAFGIPVPMMLLVFTNVLLLLIIGYFALRDLRQRPIAQTAISLILAGGIGNLIDRVFRGSVIDFIAIWKWPTFNLADIYIMVGVLLILVFYGKIKKV